MTRPEPVPSLAAEALLEHADWLRRLAGVLVLDPGGADDVAQETWLAALQSPPAGGREPRAWLATVARNAARRRRRQGSRRAEREARAASPETVPAADEVVARATLSRRVVGAVLALDEPYRSTLLLRYFEDLPPREIARRLERPVNTVRTHLERGLALLRRRLDGEFGDRESWCVALLPFLPEGSVLAAHGAVAWSLGGLLMSWKLLVPLALSILALIVWRADDAVPDAPASDPALAMADLEPPDEASPSERPPTIAVEDARSEAGGPTSAPAPSAPSFLHAGRAVDLLGAPVPGLRLQLAEGRRPARAEDHVRTAADGRYELELGFIAAEPRLADDGWTLFASGLESAPGGEDETVLVVARAVGLRGRVVDADSGQPIPGCHVHVGSRLEALAGFPLRLRDVRDHKWSTMTDAEGNFELAGVARFEGAQVRVAADGYRLTGALLEDVEGSELVFRLERVADDEHQLAGVVLGADGLRVAGAQVSFGNEETSSGADGRFSMRFRYFHERDVLIARKDRAAPALIEGLGDQLSSRPEVGRELVLRLGTETWSLAGRVVDVDGNPRGGVIVELVDGVQHGTSSQLVEGVIAGRGSQDVVTDANGRFLHGGLFRERYSVRARDPATFLCTVAADVPAESEELELVLDESRLLPEVRGVVVDRAGRPVGGATLGLTVDRIGCDEGGPCMQSSIDLGTSDEHGRFALRGVAHEHVRLSVRGAGVESAQFELDPHHVTALELTVGLRLRFRLGGAPPEGADAVEVHDERGERLTITGILSDVTSLIQRVPLGGRFGRAKLEVSDAAVELVYLTGDEVLARRPLELRRGQVVVVD